MCKRTDLEYPSLAYNVYETKDGKRYTLGMVEAKFWKNFCEAVGHEELLGHGLDREWEAPELFETVRQIMKTKTADEWTAWLDEPEHANMCAAKVNTKTEAIAQLTEENPEALAYVDFPRVGRVLQTGLPHHLSTIPTPISEYKAVSDLGEDTAAELKKVGYDDATIQRLRRRAASSCEDFPPEEDRARLRPTDSRTTSCPLCTKTDSLPLHHGEAARKAASLLLPAQRGAFCMRPTL